jgi:SAM-dependent methyltransferase
VSVRRRVKNALLTAPIPARERVLRAGYRGYERYLSLRSPGEPQHADPDGLPLPPARLRVLVVSTADPAFFLETGRAQVRFVEGLLADNAVRIEELRSILDLGCGCGRLGRWWGRLEGPRLYGCDYNPELAEWCAANLPFMEARTNALEPPLPFATEEPFGLIYAHSVFTHLTEDLQRRWVDEIRCSLGPGDLFLFTVSGERYRNRLAGEDLERFDRGEPVVHFDEVAGTNMCAAYHPPAYVESSMLEGFELLAAVREATPEHLGQDVYLARRN